MNPDAATIAAAGPVDIDISQLQPGQRVVTLWASRPVFVVKRAQPALDELKNPKLLSQLRDPDSQNLQQPTYATNWSRSLKPEILVLVGVCTHLGCIPLFDPQPSATERKVTTITSYAADSGTSAPSRLSIWLILVRRSKWTIS